MKQASWLQPSAPKLSAEGTDANISFVSGMYIEFLKMRWGAPDQQVRYPPADGGELADQKGLVLFEVSGWSDAAGHATLWDGARCYDECYFNEPGVPYRTDRANFWSLP